MEQDSADETRDLYRPELLPTAGTCYVRYCARRLFIEAEVKIDIGHKWEGQGVPCSAHDGLLTWFKDTFHERSRDFATHGLWFQPDRSEHTVGFRRQKGGSPYFEMLRRTGQNVYVWPTTPSTNLRYEPIDFVRKIIQLELGRSPICAAIARRLCHCDEALEVIILMHSCLPHRY